MEEFDSEHQVSITLPSGDAKLMPRGDVLLPDASSAGLRLILSSAGAGFMRLGALFVIFQLRIHSYQMGSEVRKSGGNKVLCSLQTSCLCLCRAEMRLFSAPSGGSRASEAFFSTKEILSISH